MFFSSCLLLICPGGDQWALPLGVQLKVACSLEQSAEQLGRGVQKQEAFQTQAYLLLGSGSSDTGPMAGGGGECSQTRLPSSALPSLVLPVP